jgi:hypothetical protein
VPHGELLGVNAALTAVIGVAGTLLGSLSTYLFQSRTAKRAEAFARNERLRQEQLTACSVYAGSLTELKQGLIRVWFHREDRTELPGRRPSPTAIDWALTPKLPGSVCSSFLAIPT